MNCWCYKTMGSLYIYTIYGRNKTPACIGINVGNNLRIIDLYQFNGNKLYKDVRKECQIIKDMVINANQLNHDIITTDFKTFIKVFDLPLPSRPYNVYDLHLPDIKAFNNKSRAKNHKFIKIIIDKMKQAPILPYQKIIANASVVYCDWENRGIIVDHELIKSEWSIKTFTGRSKSLSFNIHGYSNECPVYLSYLAENNILIHFDWICADIRMAALLARDEKLEQTFIDSDPYTYMMKEINEGAVGQLSRDEAKQFLLKSINAMDLDSIAFLDIFPVLGTWIKNCKLTINNKKSLKTILNRKFNINNAKNQLSVLNGIMQGSVVHAMQLVIRELWEKIPGQLVTEIYDSLVISCEPSPSRIRATIDLVTRIMLRPFAGHLDNNPVFPLKVSIGKKWKQWQLFETHYADRVIIHGKQSEKQRSQEDQKNQTTQIATTEN